MTVGFGRVSSVLCLLFVAGGMAGACSTSVPQSSSATHFLDDCAASCAGGLQCICGTCTKACDASADCRSISVLATCVDRKDSHPTCRGEGPTHVCDVACSSNDDCSDLAVARSCDAGFCRPETASGSELDASFDGQPGSGGAGGSGGTAGTRDLLPPGGAFGGDGQNGRGGTGGGAGGTRPVPDATAGDSGIGGGGGQYIEAGTPEGGDEAGTRCHGCGLPHPITVDATNVYWTTLDVGLSRPQGVVYKMPLSGGVPIPLALGAPGSSIVVDATTLYYFDPDESANGRLVTLPLDGSSPKVLGSGSVIWGSTIAVDSTSVYWGRLEGNFGESSIIKVPLNGGPETVLAARQPTNAGIAVAVDATSAYFTLHGNNEAVMKVSLTGGAPKILTQDVPVGYGLAVDATSVYFTGGDAVMKMPLDGVTPTTLASVQKNPNALVIDGTNIYWTTMGLQPNYHATVMKVPLAGGTPTAIAPGERGLWGLAVDASKVYWVDPLTDTVKSAPK